MSLAAGTALSKIQEIVARNDHQYTVPEMTHGRKYEQLTREELSSKLDEKDHVIGRQKSEMLALQT